MEQFLICTILGVLGLCMGSFAGASVWRLRARQLVEDKRAGDAVGSKEYKQLRPLAQASLSEDRSRCLHCGHALAWYDLLPLVSWASTGGTCRYCHRKIGLFEPTIELGVAGVFIVSYLLWPEVSTSLGILQFILWLVALVLLAILFAYDLRWFLLPNATVFPLIAVRGLSAFLTIIGSHDVGMTLVNILGASYYLVVCISFFGSCRKVDG